MFERSIGPGTILFRGTHARRITASKRSHESGDDRLMTIELTGVRPLRMAMSSPCKASGPNKRNKPDN